MATCTEDHGKTLDASWLDMEAADKEGKMYLVNMALMKDSAKGTEGSHAEEAKESRILSNEDDY